MAVDFPPVDLAYRTYAHTYRLDAIIRSLLDQDFYKFLMGQIAFFRHKDVDVTWELIIRDKSLNLVEALDHRELVKQLDHARTISYDPRELFWLQGNTFYGKKGMFHPDYIEFLKNFRLPAYECHRFEGGIRLRFPGKLYENTYWEMHALSIISELIARKAMKGMSRFELDVMYSRAKTKLWEKLQRLKTLPDLNLTDFGTRRRHGHLWQEWAIQAAREVLGNGFTGTSNAYFAMKLGLDAKGTKAHERDMVATALADTEEQMVQAQYNEHDEWAEFYDGALQVLLPDTYGTTQFLRNAPERFADWTAARLDSKDPFVGGEEMIEWWRRMGHDPSEKLLLATDGLDVDAIMNLHTRFHGRTKIGYGWGTMLTNDFIGCHPYRPHALHPYSIIVKPVEVNGRPAVKLSDNYAKSTGYAEAIERYWNVFGTEGVTNIPVVV